MKSKRVLRYYCDYCKKSGCGKAHMRRHEEHCTNNPQRKCRMCADLPESRFPRSPVRYRETPLAAMVECVQTNPPDAALKLIREMAEGCPACMLAAIRQGRGPYKRVEFDGDGAPSHEEGWFDFDFKAEAQQYLSDKHEPMNF